MRSLIILLVHLLSRAIKLLGTDGARAVLAENLLLKHQLLVLRRNRQRPPRFSPVDRLLLGFSSSFLNPRRLLRTAIILRPATLLRFHRGLRDFKTGSFTPPILNASRAPKDRPRSQFS